MKKTILTLGLAVFLVTGFTASASACDFGCTPGFWKQDQHLDEWEDYSPSALVSVVFGCGPDVTLLAALSSEGGGEYALTRHAVASLLNAAEKSCFDGGSPAYIISAYCAAINSGDPGAIEAQKDLFERNNDQDCDLGGAGLALGQYK